MNTYLISIRKYFSGEEKLFTIDAENKQDAVAKENPQDHHVTDFSIASDDCGTLFCYGVAMSGKFNMTIVGIKVI